MMQTKTFDVVDLINLAAAERDWDLSFDSGPGDVRELVFSRISPLGASVDVVIMLDFTCRIERSEYRRDGDLLHRHVVDRSTSAADLHVLTLELFKC